MASAPPSGASTRYREDPKWVRRTLTAAALLVLGVLVVIPLVSVFHHAFANGLPAYWDNLVSDRDTRHAILLTLTVAPLAVGANLVFGVAAAWAISRFRFPGRTLLITLIDLPFSVSPVVAGVGVVLLFGVQGFFGPPLRGHRLQIIFPPPGRGVGAAVGALSFVGPRPV